MDTSAHQIARCRVDYPVAGCNRLAVKSLGNDGDPIVATFAGAGMASVEMGFIINFKKLRVEAGKGLVQEGYRFDTHAGRAFLKGFTVTCP